MYNVTNTRLVRSPVPYIYLKGALGEARYYPGWNGGGPSNGWNQIGWGDQGRFL